MEVRAGAASGLEFRRRRRADQLQGRDPEADRYTGARGVEEIFLFGLAVRVQPGWRDKAAFLNALDWRTMSGKDDF
jgi:hypothetical protein